MQSESMILGFILGVVASIFIVLILTKDLNKTELEAINRGYATLNIDGRFQWVENDAR